MIDDEPLRMEKLLTPFIFFKDEYYFLHCNLRTWCYGSVQFSSVHLSCSVVSDSLRPRQLQHTRPPCLSPTPGIHSNSRDSLKLMSIESVMPSSHFILCQQYHKKGNVLLLVNLRGLMHWYWLTLSEDMYFVFISSYDTWLCSFSLQRCLYSSSLSFNVNLVCFENASYFVFKGKTDNNGIEEVTVLVLRILKCNLH